MSVVSILISTVFSPATSACPRSTYPLRGLSPVTVMPSMNCFCAKKKITTIGTVKIADAAIKGEAAAISEVANATALAIARIGTAIRQPGGEQAVQLKVAEKAVDAYSKLAQEATTTLVVPSNMTEVATLISSAMKMVQTHQRVDG